MIKLTVIIPVYNTQHYLDTCLKSVLNQDLNEIEIICIDDGSTDESYAILEEYGKIYNNLKVFKQENKGAGAARNVGIRNAQGKYITFMDSDDYYAAEDCLSTLFKLAEEKSVKMCGGNFIKLLPDGNFENDIDRFRTNELIESTEYASIFNYGRFIYEREMLQEYEIYFPHYKRFQDPPFFFKALVAAKKIYKVKKNIYVWRVGYRPIMYSYQRGRDILLGIEHCLTIAKENNYSTMYYSILNKLLIINVREYLMDALKDNNVIWGSINRIKSIGLYWQDEQDEIFKDTNSMKMCVKKILVEHQEIIKKCNEADNLIIYGTGIVGQYFYQHYIKYCRNFLGFAVSKKTESNKLKDEKDNIHQIDYYRKIERETTVIVAVGEKNRNEIKKKLREYDFKEICVYNFLYMRIVELEDNLRGLLHT